MKRAALLLALWPLAGLAASFDYDAYAKTTLKQIYAEAPKITEGADLFFKKRQFVVTLKSAPAKCPNGWITVVFRTLGIKEPPPVNHCITVTDGERENEIYVQDQLADALKAEVKVGQPFRAYVLYCFYNGASKKPGFVLNEFEAVGREGNALFSPGPRGSPLARYLRCGPVRLRFER